MNKEEEQFIKLLIERWVSKSILKFTKTRSLSQDQLDTINELTKFLGEEMEKDL